MSDHHVPSFLFSPLSSPRRLLFLLAVHAGASSRMADSTAEIDKWCLAQAKDLELFEEVRVRVLHRVAKKVLTGTR